MNLKQIINKYRNKKGIWWPSLQKDIEFIKHFDNIYSFAKNENVQFKAYIVEHDLNYDTCKCPSPNCNNLKRFNKNKNKFFVYCSDECKLKNVGNNISNSKKNLSKVVNENIQTKRRNTNLEKYGYTEQFIGLKSQIKKNILDKYGVDNIFKDKDFKLSRKSKNYNNQEFNLHLDEWLSFTSDDFIKKFGSEPYTKEIANYFNISLDSVRNKLQKLNIKYKKHSTSFAESEIIDFINNPDTIQGDRILINKELDILVPNNFAIEYHGLMFHSHGISDYSMFNNPIPDINKHLVKTDLCEDKNIQLFQIFENEWQMIHLQNIWKSIINSKLNNTKKIHARKCVVKEVDIKDSKIFESNNHLQGIGNSSIRYGLYYKDELVSLMTFKKDVKYQWELNRFCTKLNNTIVGGASKLLKHFERTINPNTLLSYANRRWSTGNLYKTIGFIHLHNSSSNYFYFHNDDKYNLKSRVNFQKHKLENKLKLFDKTLSETNNMFNNGYRKIYDSGNMVFLKTYNK
jgi:hypothetical protein